MSEFAPDFSSPQALARSYRERAKTMRQAASTDETEVGRTAFTAEAEDADARAAELEAAHA
jgi:hypothetical protein